jgi:murein tripeptide amidase MpaA
LPEDALFQHILTINPGKNQTGALPDLSWFDGYHPFQDHLDYLDDLSEAFNNSETFVSGKSLEGREQKGIHFWGKHGKGKNKAILWHGTTHAREWISAMTVEYLAYQLIAGYGKSELVTSFLDDYDFYLIPFVNPDGFVYTQTNDRLWRKNRQPPPPGTNSTCWGVDLNRNWPHEWDTNPEGSSNNSCSQTYRGAYPASEPEMVGMAGFADKLAESQGLKLFIDWHSYSQLLLTPYGFSCDTFPETNEEHIALMNATAEAIASVHGTNYTVGPGCETLYPTNGASYDYAYDISGAEWASLIELRDEGEFGFVLPPEQILPNCEEIWAGMQVFLARI